MKRYNLLVPDIFPKKQPDVSDKVDASTERKYKKLYEYIAKNPHRGPKVPLLSPRAVPRNPLMTGHAHHGCSILASAPCMSCTLPVCSDTWTLPHVT